MRRKTYVSPKTDVVMIHTANRLQTGSVMTPGNDNEPAGVRLFEDDDWLISSYL